MKRAFFPSDKAWHLITVGDEAIDLATVEIRNADAFREPSANKSLHAPPAIEIVDTSVQVLLVFVKREQIIAVLFVRHRPVNQIQVQVLEPKVLQGRLASFSNGFRVMECVPHLARDEQILSEDGEKDDEKFFHSQNTRIMFVSRKLISIQLFVRFVRLLNLKRLPRRTFADEKL